MAAAAKGKDGFEEVTTAHSVKVLGVPHLSERMLDSINRGRFEWSEIDASLKVFKKGDRIVEMGTGIGFVGAVVAKNTQPQAMLTFEGNPNLFSGIDALYRHNRLGQKIEARHAIVISAPDAPETVSFNVRGNYLGSALNPRSEGGQDVPVQKWDDIVAEFKPNALLMDIEGAELEFFRHADLSTIDRIVFEFHRPVYGRSGVVEIKTRLINEGFSQVYHESGVKAFSRN